MSDFEKQPENAAPAEQEAAAQQNEAPAAQPVPAKKSASAARTIAELVVLVIAVVAIGIVGELKKPQWWCLLRANLGSVKMQYALAESYAAGDSPEDQKKADMWFRRAAKSGHAKAAERLADATSDNAERIRLLSKPAEQGDAKLQYKLAQAYRAQGRMESAAKWYAKAAEKDLPEAIHALAGCYYYGEGVKLDVAKSKELYKKAAKLGYGPSEARLEAVLDEEKKAKAAK